jgi:hypothetical protein
MKITAKDFDALTDTIMGWKGNDWEIQAHRFTDQVSFDWAVCYWVETAANLILARTFLEDNDHAFEASYDENMESYILLTNYDSYNMAVSA